MSKAPPAVATLPPQAQPQINLLPKDPLEAQFSQLFPHPWNWIKSEGSGWKTITQYPLQPRDLIRYWRDPHTLVGVSFDSQTAYGLLDLDIGGDYHPLTNPAALEGIKAALEDVGIARSLLLRSSDSDGVWLLIPLTKPVSSFRLSQVLHGTLKKAGFSIRPGHLEVFPNLKHWDAAYHAHRLPLQQGSCLLDNDLQPLGSSLEAFLRAWKSAAAGQDIDTLESSLGTYQGIKPTSRESERARAFREDLQARITAGWTGDAQTNDLLLDIGRLCRIFHRLGGNLLVKKISELAQSLPGYHQHCDHQHEIERRAKDVARWAEKRYQPIGFQQAITEPMSPRGPNNIDKAKDAQERIKAAVAAIETGATLPTRASEWRDAIAQQGISPRTLYKYPHLWHPEHRIKVASASIPVKQDKPLSLPSQAAPSQLEELGPLKDGFGIHSPYKKCMSSNESPLAEPFPLKPFPNPHPNPELLSESTEQPQQVGQATKISRVREVALGSGTLADLPSLPKHPVHLKQLLQAKQHQELGQKGLPNPAEVEVTSSQLEAAGILGYSAPPEHGWTFRRGELSPRLWKRLRRVVFATLLNLSQD
ncbi:hypothetical protein [Pseudanabaena sp. FACHB-2040]|uniref:hypothetical protein n=1 Tax=Pseudanabaena sp. FACHB-2040 TaxID=2692859 RepID=UPI0016864035|nr:hypothetical protein [Pseudanabaena sp. FACHB-2040]MBD2261160.1 hypothetical protein [Pseudanabaena sp. FACHB-2040]